MFANHFARAFSLHEVLGDIEAFGSSATSNGVSQSVFHEVRFFLAAFACESSFGLMSFLGTRSPGNIQGLAACQSLSRLARQSRVDICAYNVVP